MLYITVVKHSYMPEFHWLWYVIHYCGEQLYLLGHEVQPALQSVCHLDLSVVIVHFHTSAADTHTHQNKQTSALSRVYELGCHVCQLIDYSGIPLCGLTCPMQEIGSGRF